jgi:hypothetical protein
VSAKLPNTSFFGNTQATRKTACHNVPYNPSTLYPHLIFLHVRLSNAFKYHTSYMMLMCYKSYLTRTSETNQRVDQPSPLVSYFTTRKSVWGCSGSLGVQVLPRHAASQPPPVKTMGTQPNKEEHSMLKLDMWHHEQEYSQLQRKRVNRKSPHGYACFVYSDRETENKLSKYDLKE